MHRVPENRKLSDETFFVTTSLEPRRPLFADSGAAQLILNTWDFYRKRGEINLYCFVVMPDHVHFIVKVNSPLTISGFMRRFKDFVAHELEQGPIWEKGFWSEGIPSGRAFYQKLSYIHRNPAVAGLVTEESEYEWSSARDYLMDESPRIDPLDK